MCSETRKFVVYSSSTISNMKFLKNKIFAIVICLVSFAVSGLIFSDRVFGVTVRSNMDMFYGKIMNLGTPTYSNDAATKSYVDSAASSLSNWVSVTTTTTCSGMPATYRKAYLGNPLSDPKFLYMTVTTRDSDQYICNYGVKFPSYVEIGTTPTNNTTYLTVGGVVHATGLELVTAAHYNWTYIEDGGDLVAEGQGTFYGGLELSGSNITGVNSLSATTKNFVIDDPLDPENKQLIHSTLEGPEIAVFYRGEAQLQNGKAEVVLPDYFEALTRKDGRTVLLTPKFDNLDELISQLAASGVENGKFKVKTIDGQNPSQKFYWEVKAVRADVAPLEVERLKTETEKQAGQEKK